MYSTGCPNCLALKAKLKAIGVQFEECKDTQKMLELGIDEVPVLSVDGNLYSFIEAIKWINNYMKD
jgi:glutaredoxin